MTGTYVTGEDNPAADPAARDAVRGFDALVLQPSDDVAVALRDIAAGETVVVQRGGKLERATLREPIALGHKFALHALGTGALIRKYGERIGTASADIAQGMHVHIHNLASARARRTP